MGAFIVVMMMWVIIGYHQLSSVIIGYQRLSSVIIGYHRLSSVIIGYQIRLKISTLGAGTDHCCGRPEIPRELKEILKKKEI